MKRLQALCCVMGLLTAALGFAQPVANCPISKAKQAKTISDVHFYLVEQMPYHHQLRHKYDPTAAILYSPHGEPMLVKQKSILYQHPFTSVTLVPSAQSGYGQIDITLRPEDAKALYWVSKFNQGKHIAITTSHSRELCGNGKPGWPVVTNITASHVVYVLYTKGIMSSHIKIVHIPLAHAKPLAKILKAGIRR